jgi:hypothetical protein
MLLLVLAAAPGCVERKTVITSEPMGALVYRNGIPLGATPVDDHFVYYGTYHYTVVKDGYQTLQVDEKLNPPWYEYPIIEFFSENIWPLEISDVRRLHYQLQPLVPDRPDAVLNRALNVRGIGQTLGPPAGTTAPPNPLANPEPPVLPAPNPTPTPQPPAVFPGGDAGGPVRNPS